VEKTRLVKVQPRVEHKGLKTLHVVHSNKKKGKSQGSGKERLNRGKINGEKGTLGVMRTGQTQIRGEFKDFCSNLRTSPWAKKTNNGERWRVAPNWRKKKPRVGASEGGVPFGLRRGDGIGNSQREQGLLDIGPAKKMARGRGKP